MKVHGIIMIKNEHQTILSDSIAKAKYLTCALCNENFTKQFTTQHIYTKTRVGDFCKRKCAESRFFQVLRQCNNPEHPRSTTKGL